MYQEKALKTNKKFFNIVLENMKLICIETGRNKNTLQTQPITVAVSNNLYEHELINLDASSQVENSSLITTDKIVYEGDFDLEVSILPNTIKYMGEIYLVNNYISKHDTDLVRQIMSWQMNTEIEILDGLEYVAAAKTTNATIIISFYRDTRKKVDSPQTVIFATNQELEKIVTEIGELKQKMDKPWKFGSNINKLFTKTTDSELNNKIGQLQTKYASQVNEQRLAYLENIKSVNEEMIEKNKILEEVVSLQESYTSLSKKVSSKTKKLMNDLKETRELLQKIDSYIENLKNLKELQKSTRRLYREKSKLDEVGNVAANFGQGNVAAASFQNSERRQQEINKLESQIKTLQNEIDPKTQELANSKEELEEKLNKLIQDYGELVPVQKDEMFELEGKRQELETLKYSLENPDEELRGDIQKLASDKVQTDLDFVEKMFNLQTEILQKASETTEQEMNEIVQQITNDIGNITLDISNDITLDKLQNLMTKAENIKNIRHERMAKRENSEQDVGEEIQDLFQEPQQEFFEITENIYNKALLRTNIANIGQERQRINANKPFLKSGEYKQQIEINKEKIDTLAQDIQEANVDPELKEELEGVIKQMKNEKPVTTIIKNIIPDYSENDETPADSIYEKIYSIFFKIYHYLIIFLENILNPLKALLFEAGETLADTTA